MDAYRLYTVEETTLEDCFVSLNVLCYVLLTMANLMVPFTPFLAEFIYQILRKLMPRSLSSSEQELSIHFQMIPRSHHLLVNKNIEHAVAAVQTVIGLGRAVRERKVVPMKYPLPELVVIHKDESGLNVRNVILSQDRELFGIEIRAEPNHPILVIKDDDKYFSKTKSINEQIRQMSNTDIEDLLLKGEVYRVTKQTQCEATAEQGFVVFT
ncbi:unnamed protein product [Rotaria sordida]|uniref:Methionyl/Valyl/Leucyl/Isoleucyl-tRNA synthetase anticodon-binding domain-containing protein n=1 Tax=Rotaria sordida TaxID=392033 RepID=A0A814BBY0_9BILA|nr:unnamed protein product [Rotaria sordida]CAF1027215.1 unnamed protein product [Rotaria sordida]CAF1048713.1 unnamed protein product [Rotaria sordida]